MQNKRIFFYCLFITVTLILSVNSGFSQNETVETAEKLMKWQLDALKNENYKEFVEHGNKAFKEYMDKYSFDSLVMQRKGKIEKGYRLEYLGDIRSIGTRKHLWKVHITGEKYQLLGSLSLSHGKIIGFNLE